MKSFARLRGRARWSLAVTGVLVAAAGSGTAVAATPAGHDDHDGRIAGRPDVLRIGAEVHRYLPDEASYVIERSGRPDQYYHLDPEPRRAGAPYALPAQEGAPICATGGHRIIPVWHHAPGADPAAIAQIRSIVRRMNWKIAAQSEASSQSMRRVEMRVECSAGQIAVREVVSSSNGTVAIRNEVESSFGAPSGAGSVKYLIFRDGPATDAAGVGYWYRDATKSASDGAGANANRIYTTSAMIWKEYWETHTTVHELVHVMGGAQPGAPHATSVSHCFDGHDLLCYNDEPGRGTYDPPYTESACPSNGWNETPQGVALDCNWDTYFDAMPEHGEWLASNWNLGGYENPFLVDERPLPKPAVVARASGVRHMFYRGLNDRLGEWRWDGRSWSHIAWGATGAVAGDPSVVVTPDNRVEVYYRSTGGHLGRFWINPDGTTGLQNNDWPNTVKGDPAAVALPSGRVEVFYPYDGGHLRRHWFQGPAWNVTLNDYANSVRGDPAAVVLPSGVISTYYPYADGLLRRHDFDGSAWSATLNESPGAVLTNPAAAATASGRIEVFYGYPGGHLRRHWFLGPSGWGVTLNDWAGTVVGEPSAVSTPSERVEVFYRTHDGQLRRHWFDGSAWGASYSDALYSVNSDPAGLRLPDGRLEAFYAGSDGHYRYVTFSGSSESITVLR